MNFYFPPVWNLIDRFKERCRLSGWETRETEDWVKTEDGEYHSFLWTQTIMPSTFERIVTNRKCGIRRGNSYEVVGISYMGWLFQERTPEFLIGWLKDNPEFAQKTAVFDLSCIYSGEPVCRKFNETESVVFTDFEQFLEEQFGIQFSRVDKIPVFVP